MVDIFTLGRFDIIKDDVSIVEKLGSQNRLFLLLKYLLVHEGKRRTPNAIIDDLLEDKDLKDPLNVLRTQISRLRRLFEEDSFYTIDYVNGYYIFNLGEDCKIDFLEFERKMIEGIGISNESTEEAMVILKEGLALYQGHLFPEVEYNEWITPIRTRLERLYLKGLSNYLLILKKDGFHHEIIEVCEKAIQIKPYESFINKYFMEALMEAGQKRFALSHYEYYTTKLYNDLRIAPSPEIKEVYKALQNHDENLKGIIDLSMIDKELELNIYSKGALICELRYFKFLYNWELRNKGRINKDNLFLGIITLDNIGYTPLPAQDIKDGMRDLMVIVYKNLRKSDVLSKWNDSQLVMLLYNIAENDLHLINNRLQENFIDKVKNKNITLNIKFKHL